MCWELLSLVAMAWFAPFQKGGHAFGEVLAVRAQHVVAVFLDNFEMISEPGVPSLLREDIDELPRGGQLVIGSRSLPDLRLARLPAQAAP